MYQYTTEQKYMYYQMNKLTFQSVTGTREPFSTLSYTTNALNNAFSCAFWYLYVPSGILVAFRYFGAFRYLYGPVPPYVKAAACKGLVRPILEYGSSVWDPYTHGLQEELEKVQNHAARFVTGNYFFETGRTLAIRTTVVPITLLIGTTVVRISGVIRTTGKSISNC